MGVRYSIKNWVKDEGSVEKVAWQLGVTSKCVTIWMDGLGSPRAATIAKMIKLSKKKLTFDQIYKESIQNLKGK